MKYLLLLLLPALLMLTSCIEDNEPASLSCEVGHHLDDVIRLPDGLEVRITEVNDNYCPCEVICVHAGYLQVVVQVVGANRGPDTLGWQDQVAVIGDYELQLGEVYNRPACGGALPEDEFCFEVTVD